MTKLPPVSLDSKWVLTAAERERYASDGFFVREALFSTDELETLRDGVERIHARIEKEAGADPAAVERIDGLRFETVLGSTVKWEWAEGSNEIRSMEPFHPFDRGLDRLLEDPRLWVPAAGAMGEDAVSLFTDKLNFKRPGGSPFPWHQDTPYWAFGCDHVDRLSSVQLYLDEGTEENGCLWVIPGSHTKGRLPTFDDRGVIGRLYSDLDGLDLADPISLEAPAGSAIYFHGAVVHGSQTNQSSESRRALVITYQPAGHPRWRSDGAARPIG